MFEGKTHAALQLLSDKGKGGVLHLDNLVFNSNSECSTVMDVLRSKHPLGQAAHPNAIIPNTPPEVHSVIFDSIDATLIRSTSLHTKVQLAHPAWMRTTGGGCAPPSSRLPKPSVIPWP